MLEGKCLVLNLRFNPIENQKLSLKPEQQIPWKRFKVFCTVLKGKIVSDVKRELREHKKYSNMYFVLDFARTVVPRRQKN